MVIPKKVLYPLVFLALLFAGYTAVRKWHKRRVYQGTPVNVEAKTVLRLYQLMKDVHEVLMQHNVDYWVDFGTLLGAVRHQGIIPWDDDLDISVELRDEERLKALAPVFQLLGYEFIPMFYGYKIFYRDGQKILGTKNEDWLFPFLDIFVRERRGDRLYYITRNKTRHVVWGYRDADEIYITLDEVYPLQDYQFGDLKVKGPRDGKPYLRYLYGSDYFDVGYQLVNHAGGSYKKVKKQLTDADRVPAQPTGPLENRVEGVVAVH